MWFCRQTETGSKVIVKAFSHQIADIVCCWDLSWCCQPDHLQMTFSMWLGLPCSVSWISRTSVSKEPGGSCIIFYDPASEVLWHHLHQSHAHPDSRGKNIGPHLSLGGVSASQRKWVGKSCCGHLEKYSLPQVVAAGRVRAAARATWVKAGVLGQQNWTRLKLPLKKNLF